MKLRIIKTKLLGPWAGMVPLPRTILIRPDYFYSGTTLPHELVHVDQWERLGWMFLPTYVWQWIKAGFKYRRIELEIEAYSLESSEYYVEWAERVRREHRST